jgi:hypothetical protein
MKRLFSVSTFCLALLFSGSAIPGRAATIDITFTGTNGTTDISLCGTCTPGVNPGTVIGIVAPYNVSVDITGTPSDSGLYTTSINLLESYCSTTAECTAEGIPTADINTLFVTNPSTSFLGVTTNFSDALVAIALSGPLQATTTTGGNFSLNFPTGLVTGITVNPTFLSDLGVPSGAIFSLLGITNLASGGSPTVGNYTVNTSASLDITTSNTTPEPGSWVLMALGISLMVLAVRKRSALIRQ